MRKRHLIFLFQQQNFTKFDSFIQIILYHMPKEPIIIIIKNSRINIALSFMFNDLIQLILCSFHLTQSPIIMSNSINTNLLNLLKMYEQCSSSFYLLVLIQARDFVNYAFAYQRLFYSDRVMPFWQYLKNGFAEILYKFFGSGVWNLRTLNSSLFMICFNYK